jgi:hypothetical protein
MPQGKIIYKNRERLKAKYQCEPKTPQGIASMQMEEGHKPRGTTPRPPQGKIPM